MPKDLDAPTTGPLRWLPQPLVQSQDAQPQEQARVPDDIDSDDIEPPNARDPAYDHDAERDFAAESMAAPPVRWLRVRHETRYRYDSDVEGALHLAHLRPRDTATQQIRAWSLAVWPHPDAGVELASGIRETVDPWGNARQIFAHSQVHDQLDVVSAFEAGVSAQALPAPGSSRAWREVARDLRLHAGASAHAAGATPEQRQSEHAVFEAAEFALDSALAPRAQALADWARPAADANTGIVELALALMHQVHAEFEYLPQSTSVTTGALEALALRHGVCQDFAHVLIGACRSLGLAARYVSGYLLTQPPPGRPRLVGADASHAWAAVWCPPHGWLALDPTNDVVVGQDHVTLAWGRDYADVAPLRGVIRGGSGNAPSVAVTVEPL
ncbi:MAG TPA: transglutaminase family protein [Burkholderiaceae bacterium]